MLVVFFILGTCTHLPFCMIIRRLTTTIISLRLEVTFAEAFYLMHLKREGERENNLFRCKILDMVKQITFGLVNGFRRLSQTVR